MPEATLATPTDRYERLSASFPNLKIKAIPYSHPCTNEYSRSNHDLIKSAAQTPIERADRDINIGALKGALEGLRHSGCLRGTLSIIIDQRVVVSGILEVDASSDGQLTILETLLHEVNRRSMQLIAPGFSVHLSCSYSVE